MCSEHSVNATQVITVDGMNELIKQIAIFNKSNDFVLFFTIGLFITAVVANIISFHFLREELKQMRREARHKTRPILARHVHAVELKNLTEPVNRDTYALSHEKALFHFINNGSTTATNVRSIQYVEINQYGFDAPILDPAKEETATSMEDLAPTEYYSVDVFWNSDK